FHSPVVMDGHGRSTFSQLAWSEARSYLTNGIGAMSGRSQSLASTHDPCSSTFNESRGMTSFTPRKFQRRRFLRTGGGLILSLISARLMRANDLPENKDPRAIFGDPIEPDWKQRFTVTVGPGKADLV